LPTPPTGDSPRASCSGSSKPSETPAATVERRRHQPRDRPARRDRACAAARRLGSAAQTVRETHGRAGNQPETMPLFTASDLAAMKPFFVVRTRDAFRSGCCGSRGSTFSDFNRSR
jgi:hypothetical protein